MNFEEELQQKKDELLKEKAEAEIAAQKNKEEQEFYKRISDEKNSIFRSGVKKDQSDLAELLTLDSEYMKVINEMIPSLSFTTPAQVSYVRSADKYFGTIDNALINIKNCYVADIIYSSKVKKDYDNCETGYNYYHLCILEDGRVFAFVHYKDKNPPYSYYGGKIKAMNKLEVSPEQLKKGVIEHLAKKDIENQSPISIDTNAGRNTGWCYIATAVYGSYDCPQVWTLRRYRDNKLSLTWYGRAFIKTYYAISPTIVKLFGNTLWFNKIWKRKLDKMVKKLQAEGFDSTPYSDK